MLLVLVATVVLLPEEPFNTALRLPQDLGINQLPEYAVSFCCRYCCFRTRRQRRGGFDKFLPQRGGDFLVDCGHADQAPAGERAGALGEPAEGVELVEGEVAVDLDVGRVVGPVVVDEFPDEFFGVPDGVGLLVCGGEL